MSKHEDLGSERAVLAALCQYGLDVYLEIDFITSETFTDPMNQLIFGCIKKSIEQGATVELSSILSAANDFGVESQINNKEEVGFIRSLFQFPVQKSNASHYAAKLSKLELIRDFKKNLSCVKNELDSLTGEEDITEIVSRVEEPILDATASIYQDRAEDIERIGDGIDAHLEHLADNTTDFIGIPTGFSFYDTAIGGGIRRKCVDLIGARPKVGKSLFGDAVAKHVSSNLGIPVLVLDSEMSKEDHYHRMLADISGVTINDIATGKFVQSPTSHQKVVQASQILKDMPYDYASIAGKSFENILSIMRKWIYQTVGFDESGKTNDCLIVYDYLKLMTSDGINSSMQEYQVLGFQITKLHNFMVKYDCPCLAFVQLNRDGLTKEDTGTIAGSDRLAWLCTSFSVFKKKSPEEIAEDGQQNGDRKLCPVMSRHGGGLDDGDYVSIRMFGEYGRLLEGQTRNEIHNNEQGFETQIDEGDDLIHL